MHIPDGFIDAPTSIAAGAVAAGGLGVSLRRSAEALEDRQAPMAGLVAAFIFAVQMLNFPVAGGTSGHLLGGVLAAVLVGPWIGALCVSVVLVVQALLFADGGLSALGLNVVNMALVGAFVGYGVFLLVRRVLPTTRTGVVTASAVAALLSVVLASVVFTAEYAIGGTGAAALLSVVLASVVFTAEYAIGGTGAASLSRVAGAMVGVHVLIGIGEAIITAMTVSAVLSVRPDLVYGATDPAAGPVTDTATTADAATAIGG